VPVFLFDPIKKPLALSTPDGREHIKRSHSNDPGDESKFGCHPQDLKVVLGPSIRAYSYEVGPEFKDYFPQDIIERGGNCMWMSAITIAVSC